MRAIYRRFFHLGRGPSFLAATGVILLMLHTVANLFARAWGSPIAGTTESAAGWYMPVIVFLGLVRAQQFDEQIEARLVFDRVPRPVQLQYQLFSLIGVLILALFFAWFGWLEAWDATAIRLGYGVSGVPIWPVKYLVPIGFLLLAVQAALDAYRVVRFRTLPNEWGFSAEERASL